MNSQNNFIFDWLDFRIARYSHGKKNSEFCTYFHWVYYLSTVGILDFNTGVLTHGSHLLSFQPRNAKIGMDEGLPIGSHLVPRKLTSASTRRHLRPFS